MLEQFWVQSSHSAVDQMFLNCFHCQNSWQIINSSFLVIGTLWGQKEFTLIWRPKSKTTIFKTNSLCDLVRTLWPCLWASWEFIHIFRAICIFSATFLGKGWQKPYLWWERSTPLSQAVGERFGCGSPPTPILPFPALPHQNTAWEVWAEGRTLH